MRSCAQLAGADSTTRYKDMAGLLREQGWRVMPAVLKVSPLVSFWYVRPHAAKKAAKAPAQLTSGVDYFESEQEVEAFLESRELVGCLVKRWRGGGGGGGGGGGSGGGGGGSATQERGVVVARVTASGRGAGTGSGSKRPQPGSEGQLYRVQFQGGATEVLRRRAVLGMVDDSRGPGPEECSVCFTEYGGMGGGESEGEGEGEGDDESEGADEDGAAGEEAAKQPAMLTCGHVFCAGCVGTMHSNEQESGGACSNTRSGGACIKCPQCRTIFRRTAGT
jgi:hypothetical protein